jgi:hypothetical protein
VSESRLRLIAACLLVIGAVLGMAGTFAPSTSLRGLAWGLDGTALIVATALLTVYHLRRGNDLPAVLINRSLALMSARADGWREGPGPMTCLVEGES